MKKWNVIGVALAMTASVSSMHAQTRPDSSYTKSSDGLRSFDLGPMKVKVMLDSAALKGSEMEMVEITFPGNSAGGTHVHGRLEVIYVLEGEMDHIVNGTAHHLKPGGVGVVRIGDNVIHRVTSSTPVRALVMWVPGGELGKLERR